MNTIICPKCKKQGYLIKEKPRKIHTQRRRLFGNKRHKPYESAKRQPKPILRIVHNVKIGDKWSVKMCYLGVFQRVVYKFRNYKPVDNSWGPTLSEVLRKFEKEHKLESFDSKLPSDLKIQQKIANFFVI